MSSLLTRERRAELLAIADPTELTQLADALLARFEPPTVVAAPEVGVVMMQVREPVCRDRFQLGEIVVSRAEVAWCGADGWAMRLGTDREAALSAALCDAAAEFDPAAAAEVASLCRRTEAARAAADASEWAALAATRVTFEELD